MQETDNTTKIRELLSKYTDKEVVVGDIRQSGLTCLAGNYEADDHYGIGLNYSFPSNVLEAAFVHEVQEIILLREGFPLVSIDQMQMSLLSEEYKEPLPKLAAFFQSVILHPEVFRRMHSDYQLDMESYLDIEMQQKQARLDRYGKGPFDCTEDYFLSRQQDILWGLDYFNYGSQRAETLLKAFYNLFPFECHLCERLYEDVVKGSLRTPPETRASAEMIHAAIKEYAEDKDCATINGMWSALYFGQYNGQ